jgi:hypothetical protein
MEASVVKFVVSAHHGEKILGESQVVEGDKLSTPGCVASLSTLPRSGAEYRLPESPAAKR